MSNARWNKLAVVALLTAAGTMAPSADAQLVGPETGWVPGQPVLVSITTRAGAPLLVVYAGRIPLASESRVRLVLPDLGDNGLMYTLTTTGQADFLRRRPQDTGADGVAKKPQEVVGRVHSSFEKNPAPPTLGTGSGNSLSVSDTAADYTLGSVSTGSNPGVINSTVSDDNGTRRRDITVPTLKGRWHATGEGVLGRKKGSLGLARGRVHTFDSSVVGPLEAGSGGSGGSQAGLTIVGSHPHQKDRDTPTIPRTKSAPRPINTVPFPTQSTLLPGGNLGTGGVVILIDDKGLEFEGSAG